MDSPVGAPVDLGKRNGIVADYEVFGPHVTLYACGKGYFHVRNGIAQSYCVGYPVQYDVFLHHTAQLIMMGINGPTVKSHQVIVVNYVSADLVPAIQMLDTQVADIGKPVIAGFRITPIKIYTIPATAATCNQSDVRDIVFL